MTKQTYQIERLNALLPDAMARMSKAHAEMQKCITNGYVLGAETIKNLSRAQTEVRFFATLGGQRWEDKDDEARLAHAKHLLTELRYDVLRAASGAADRNELNSTCTMTRAFAAVELSARAEAVETLTSLLA